MEQYNKRKYNFTDIDFSSLNLNSCDTLSKMSYSELQELLSEINLFNLQLRPNIGLPEKVTFGLEIEFEDALYNHVSYDLIKLVETGGYNSWELKCDSTVCLKDRGGEITTPILRDKADSWVNLYNVCMMLESHKAGTENSSGAHVHIGSNILDNNIRYWANMLKLWMVYEKLIYRFSYGDKLGPREGILTYAPPIGCALYKYIGKINNLYYPEDLKPLLPQEKRQSLNFKNAKLTSVVTKNTLEFRCPNGTINSCVWQNNVNFFTKFLLYCASDNFDDDFFNSKLEKYEACDGQTFLDLANEVYLNEALELCDLIFNNNMDKVYFLKQYLKNFRIPKYSMENKTLIKL